MSANTKYSPEAVESVIEYWFPEPEYQGLAKSIFRCESKYNNLAVNWNDIKLNGHASVGVAQVSLLHKYEFEYLLNPYNNLKVARELFEKSGKSFRPWLNCMKIAKRPSVET